MTTPPLSIIMASHNDADQTVLTIASIRETSPPDVEIVVIDDCSATPLHHYVKPDEHTKLITNRNRCGCGPSRHIGALSARGEWLLICDSHMRFTDKWYPRWLEALNLAVALPGEVGSKHTVFCATCLGLDSKHMDVNNPVSEYHGATMNLYGPDRNNPQRTNQVFEAVWLPKEPELEDGAEIPAIMGACYFVSREWFLHLAPTRYLRTWGCDEQMISLKSWLSGGSVRLAKSVRIGHKFLIEGREMQAFGVPPGHVIYNKLLAINTLLSDDVAATLLSRLLLSGPEANDIEAANRMYREDYYLVAQERVRNAKMFTRDVRWYCEKFGIQLP